MARLGGDRCSGGTFFPKITLKIFDHLPLTGTVKLHGIHLDLVIYPDDTVRLQSRYAHSIGLENDVYDFAKHMLPRQKEIIALRTRYISRYKDMNPSANISKDTPLIIAGEWIGRGINNGVAVCELPEKCFVIISVCVNNRWLPDEPYSKISNEAAGIYNISRGGFYNATIDVTTEKTPNVPMEMLQAYTLVVERSCPFAETFGISGNGEGIVWKAEHPLSEHPQLWFKTKSPLYNHQRRLEKMQSDNPRVLAKVFAEDYVTEARLDQVFHYLLEIRIVPNEQAEKEFVTWLVNDIEVGERYVSAGGAETWKLLG
ncbi:hypothetical protein DL95DRAFT_481455 [Leptodontidium sp. 2 PMI_412]|nr:hypothetical protein DL95DRAFT_481455 [Leptodontidium sp. 2 PMI_412]